MALEDVQTLTMHRWMAVIHPDERIFGLYLVSACILAFFSWLYYKHAEKREKPESAGKSFLSYLFDKDAFLHPSAKQDYLYFFINGFIYVGIISQLLISTHLFTVLFHTGLDNTFGVQEAPIVQASLLTLIVYTLVYALLTDFSVYITHYLQHKVPILWEFHKVHHSAEVLNPITLYRMHPVDMIFTGVVAAILLGGGFAGFFYLTGEMPNAYEYMGLNIIVFLFYLFGYNLRHSHIWLAYPRWLSNILISPAQHQIHHSIEPKHFDKNMGLIFAFWDKLFGTLYVPAHYEKISYGISKAKPNPFNNVWEMYVTPFKNAWRIMNKGASKKLSERAVVFIAFLLFLIFNYTIFLSFDRALMAENKVMNIVHTEDLTWTEIQRAMDERGFDTIIIPTGGIEQNGAHLTLGKHGFIVHHNAGVIAKRLGKTFVAPVISYVPEEIHMDYAGTVSVPDKVFESLLEATARSYYRHGFKNILFIGDSFGNQVPQQNIANKLSSEWRDENITIAHISDYYNVEGQLEWLMQNKGLSKEQIGGHAGIRDTSEIMHIYPEGLRKDPWFVEGRDTGHSGLVTLSSKEIGEQMTTIKVESALKQIKSILGKEETNTKALDEALTARPYR